MFPAGWVREQGPIAAIIRKCQELPSAQISIQMYSNFQVSVSKTRTTSFIIKQTTHIANCKNRRQLFTVR